MLRSSGISSNRNTKRFASAAKMAYRHADRAATSLGRWITTDHSGFSSSMLNMPPLDFINGCRYILVHFAIALAGTVLYGLMIFMLIAIGIPTLLSALFS